MQYLLKILSLCLSLSSSLPFSCAAGASQTFDKLASYSNPIISGFAPDPSCIRVEEQFFCVTSSFSAFPGIPVYTSRDLVQWKQIGNVLSRPEQLPTLSQVNQTTGGIWAATIRHHDNRFFVTTTLVFDGKPQLDPTRWDNMIFTNDDIFSNNGNGWSDPVHFSFEGYDTSLFWDDDVDGKVYVQGSHAWHVFPAIQSFEIDLNTGKNLSEIITLWTGTGGIAPEGPHIYKRSDAYYLMIAEGGTGLGHMETMARAENITGPYTPCPYNPVLTNANTTEYLQTVGHADLFNDTNGNWWAVALATRNGTVNFPMGRETVLVPVVWEEGQFPVFNGGKPGRVHVSMTGPLPLKQSPTAFPDTIDPLVGHPQNVTFPPNTTPPRQLVYYRFPDFSSFTVSPDGHPNALRIMGSAENITGDGFAGTSSFIMRRQDALEFSATSRLQFDPRVENEEAGMSLFIQRTQHFDLSVVRLPVNNAGNVTAERLGNFVILRTIDANSSSDGLHDTLSTPAVVGPLMEGPVDVLLKIQAVNASTYSFSYSDNQKDKNSDWVLVGTGAASEVSGGFTGTLVGMFATGNGRNSTTPAYFSDFEYFPVEGVY
ncbi:hypothetical protein SCHPADRAFT_831656 [Schizopora paradoxa]|uniref:Beta-xylosidase C-terminal Concanavalin A-like domain-containing protein n=1 Tax=Schizopora paradoxa TaxID=27342 RepID=A0A0H2RGU6_9AGAM|nr:hypothetical protein SCHPADRAFT_831656 [Schizopora paradoxa]